jgi:hypothetical protein
VVSAPLWDTASAKFAGKLARSCVYVAKLINRNVHGPRCHSYHPVLLPYLELGRGSTKRRAAQVDIHPRHVHPISWSNVLTCRYRESNQSPSTIPTLHPSLTSTLRCLLIPDPNPCSTSTFNRQGLANTSRSRH